MHVPSALDQRQRGIVWLAMTEVRHMNCFSATMGIYSDAHLIWKMISAT